MTTTDIDDEPQRSGSLRPEGVGTAKRLLTIREAGQVLGLGRTTMYELISSERLEVVHIGRSVRIPVEAIDDFVRQLRVGQAS